MSVMVAAPPTAAPKPTRSLPRIFRSKAVLFGSIVLGALILIAIFASVLGVVDPAAVQPRLRLKPPSAAAWLGTDHLGRDVYSRLIYGSRVSLLVGGVVALLAVVFGALLGLVSGAVRWIDGLLMRAMDGVMAIPAILFAVAMIGALGADLVTICIAIAIPEIPRVARLVRSVVLTVREEPYIEAAVSMGTRTPTLIARHMVPNVLAPLIAQATYIASSAILIEASLSFLGIGMPDEIPSWGNMMANARLVFQVKPMLMLLPGLCIVLTVFAINRIGDGLRDLLDPRLAKSVGRLK
ncbi:ABC transporter permease [Rhodopseudomonas palustris]|uniref:ABC transporter permease n=1 Tax=Rhodopseudomonas palustris TaxID=1076 RepID=UPI0020CF12B5|nr:ABC transporter permease [Rhodopseudomonas palustris]MCP9630304.1 ABC transporter permease [Rhodopseudomonas palustris]